MDINIKKLYVAGPMSNMVDFNFSAFFNMAAALESAGFEVENPADNDGPTLEISLANALTSNGTWEEYMIRDIPRVLKCDGVVCLPGWRQSQGATWEVAIMRKLKRPIFRWEGALKPLVSVVGLSGYAGSGKDAGAHTLDSEGWERRSYADNIRRSLYELNPIIAETSYEHGMATTPTRVKKLVDDQGWQKVKENNVEVRELLQRLGTDVGRNILSENIWVDAVMNSLEDGHKYIFTDCRFENEAKAVKEYGGKMIRIKRPGHGPINNHISETSLDNYAFDDTIINNGSLDKLRDDLLHAIT